MNLVITHLVDWATAILPHLLWLGVVAALPNALLVLTDRRGDPLRDQRVAVVSLSLLVVGMLAVGWWCRPQVSTMMPMSIVEPIATRTCPIPIAYEPVIPPFAVVQNRSALANTTGWTWGAVVWLVGMAVLSLVRLGAWLRLWRIRCQAVAAPDWLAIRFRRLAGGWAKRVRLLIDEVNHWCGPVVLGLYRPTILVPAAALGLEVDQLDALLRHELAHIIRRDTWTNLLVVMVETVLFFHPAARWLCSRVRDNRELLADATACRSGDRLVLARALLALSPPRNSVILAANGGGLAGRVRALIGAPVPAQPTLMPISLIVTAIVLAGLGGCVGNGRAAWDPHDLILSPLMDGFPVAPDTAPSRQQLLRAAEAPCRIDVMIRLYASPIPLFEQFNTTSSVQLVMDANQALEPLQRHGAICLSQPRLTVNRLRRAACKTLHQFAFVGDYVRKETAWDVLIRTIDLGWTCEARLDADGYEVMVDSLQITERNLIDWLNFRLELDSSTSAQLEVPRVAERQVTAVPGTRLGPDQCLILRFPEPVMRSARPEVMLTGLPAVLTGIGRPCADQDVDGRKPAPEDRFLFALVTTRLVGPAPDPDPGAWRLEAPQTPVLDMPITMPAAERTIAKTAEILATQAGLRLDLQDSSEEGIPICFGCSGMPLREALRQFLRLTLLRARIQDDTLTLIGIYAAADQPVDKEKTS